jgi:predicted anti-sigma-YlaC factor YlaD
MKMKCDEVRLLLVSFADGALVGARAEVVREHVAGCAQCREELAQLAADAELLRKEEKPEVPAYLGTRIKAGIREKQVQGRPWFGLSRAMARVAAVLLVAVGVWLGTALARGMVGPQQSLTDRLAQVGLELPNEEEQ